MARTLSTTVEILFKRDEATRAASVEMWVVLTTLLIVVKFALDSFGPWYSNKFMAATVQFLQSFNYSTVQYTLGLMQLSYRKNDFYLVWAVLMVTLQSSVKVGSPYGRSKRMTLIDMMSSMWAANLLKRQTFMLLYIPLWLIWFLNAVRIIAYFSSSERASRINQDNMRLVNDYMSYEHRLSDSAAVDPVTMSGYKYLVSEEDQKGRRSVEAPKFIFQLDMKHAKLITTESVWNLHSDKLLGDHTDTGNRLKDVCLSFALYKLLRRRFYNLPLHEDVHNKTRRLIVDGILKGDGGYERAFRITEVELSFLQDFFHGNHAVMFVNGFPVRRLILSAVLVFALSFVAYPVRYITIKTDNAKLIGITHGVFITRSIIVLIVGKELWEIFVYVFSQWTKISMLCTYINQPSFQCPTMEKAVRLMFRLISRGQWDQQIRQYNLLISCRYVKLVMAGLRPKSIRLQKEVKEAIFESFNGLKGPQCLDSYFSDAFGGNQVRIEQFSWANEFEADTHRILVWHIATCLCEINFSSEAAKVKTFWSRPRLFAHESIRTKSKAMWDHYVTAVTLSNYCAYLLIRSPKLVPDNNLVSINVFSAVRQEVYSATSRCKTCKTLQDIHDRLMKKATESDGEDDSIVKMGAELEQQLLQSYQEDSAGVWTVLAKFWTGFLLHLAASTKAKRHKRHLEGRGELATHLWALLSHAGFLRSSNGDEGSFGLDGTDED